MEIWQGIRQTWLDNGCMPPDGLEEAREIVVYAVCPKGAVCSASQSGQWIEGYSTYGLEALRKKGINSLFVTAQIHKHLRNYGASVRVRSLRARSSCRCP